SGQPEDRDQMDEFKSFEAERNAELDKIIAERNKIIDDINLMVNKADNEPGQFNQSPPIEQPVINEHVDIPDKEETTVEIPVMEEHKFDEPIIEKPVIETPPIEETQNQTDDIIKEEPLKEDRGFEKKFQYEETNLLKDNYDPIGNDEEEEVKQSFDAPVIKEEKKTDGIVPANFPKSFEDVFETKENIDEKEKQKEHIHSSLPPVNRDIGI